jgi:hypothetical protein
VMGGTCLVGLVNLGGGDLNPLLDLAGGDLAARHGGVDALLLVLAGVHAEARLAAEVEDVVEALLLQQHLLRVLCAPGPCQPAWERAGASASRCRARSACWNLTIGLANAALWSSLR